MQEQFETETKQAKLSFSTTGRKKTEPRPVPVHTVISGIFALISLSALLLAAAVTRGSTSEKRAKIPAAAVDTLRFVHSAEKFKLPENHRMAPFPAEKGQEKMHYMIVADKYSRVLHLLENQNGFWGVICSFPIAVGAREGRKVHAGDLKTPEGIYFITGIKHDSELSKIYGPAAYTLNYPNRQDQIEGRTGQGIWIHGTEPGKVPVDTRGCIEMHNTNLLKLVKLLGTGIAVPVIIHSTPDFCLSQDIQAAEIWEKRTDLLASAAEYEQTPESAAPEPALHRPEPKKAPESADSKEIVFSTVQKWRKDWESADIKKYESYYDTVYFQSGGWKQWRAKKAGTFKCSGKISVTLSDLSAEFRADSTVSVIFLQKYRSEILTSESWKRLDMSGESGRWKIIGETTAPSRTELTGKSGAQRAGSHG